MTKGLSLLVAACSIYFIACGDSASDSDLDNLTYVNENGEEISIDVSTGNFKDPRDGKSYNTITIGEQTWMAENLTYSGGGDSPSDEKYGWTSAQSACPEGWHLSQTKEWLELFKALEKVYGDSAGWALKSTSSWESDTTDGEVVSGNGGDILNFDIKPTGICRGSDCRYQGKMAGFWTMSKVDRDGYADYIRFERDPSWHSNDIYRDARLHVRCVNDKGTIFESLGKCTDEKEGAIGEHDSTYYICKELFWETATMEEKLDFTFGECNAEIANQRFMLQDTSFLCEASEYSTIVHATPDRPGELGYATSYHWIYTPKDTVLSDCKAKGDTLCQFRDTTYYYDSPYWKEAQIDDLYPCNSKMDGKLVSLNKIDFVCIDTTWEAANGAYKEKGACSKSVEFDTVQVIENNDTLNYVCFNKRWQPYQPIEYALGFCNSDGAKGAFGGEEFVCNAKEHVWIHAFTDKRDGKTYKSVAVGTMLVMAENLKYGGDSLFEWHKAVDLDAECDSTECAETLSNPSLHQGICPDGWSLLSKDDSETLLYTYTKQNIHYADIWIPDESAYFTPMGWPDNFGSNRSGLNFTPYTTETEYSPTSTVEVPTITTYGTSYQTQTIGGNPTQYKYYSGTWLSNEDTRNYAYRLLLSQFVSATTDKVTYINATTDSQVSRKKYKSPVRCKKMLEIF